MTDHRDIVEAFLDRESVEAPALEAALADPAGREYFMDLLVLRGLIGNAALPVVAETASRIEARTGFSNNVGSPRRSAWWLAAAAVLVVIGTAGGYFAGKGNRAPDAPQVQAPREQTGPGAPRPTHVIRLENGVTWNEKSGGN
jgi:hypothetical protein